MMRVLLLLGCVLLGVVFAQVPDRDPVWMLNASTIVMPCNDSGLTDPAAIAGFSTVDFDWSNAKQFWVKDTPMDDEAWLAKQVNITADHSPGTTIWVYRNTVYAYSFSKITQTLLADPKYAPWFIPFIQGNTSDPKCDTNWSPPRCSALFHSQEQSPGYPKGDGDCAAPGCDCGSDDVPCGFYVFEPRSKAVIDGQTFQEWFINDYMFGPLGNSPHVSGFFWDDVWDPQGNIHDQTRGTIKDMGLTSQDLQELTDVWTENMAVLHNKTLKAGKFGWQMLWTGGDADSTGSTCPKPLVQQDSCADNLRSLCSADSLAQNRTMMYSFGPGGCKGDPSHLTQVEQDVANFQLVRGKYAYLGHGWLGCNHRYEFPDILNTDFGEPLGLCSETADGSGVFTREWTKATVEMDCNTWTPKFTMK